MEGRSGGKTFFFFIFQGEVATFKPLFAVNVCLCVYTHACTVVCFAFKYKFRRVKTWSVIRFNDLKKKIKMWYVTGELTEKKKPTNKPVSEKKLSSSKWSPKVYMMNRI